MHARGFTLIELMIVIAIIAIIAAIAIPNLLSARLNSNESAAIATLRNLVSAQAQFQKRAMADTDGDGLGEYGSFAEMSGSLNVRGTTRVLSPPVLSSAFGSVNTNGEVGRHGYLYALYLPAANGTGIREVAGGGPGAGIDPDLAETTWVCYAWPSNYGSSGNRCFFVSQAADIISTEDETYSGPGGGPVSKAAFSGDAATDSITGPLATGMTGRDGNLWKQVG